VPLNDGETGSKVFGGLRVVLYLLALILPINIATVQTFYE
jgi:hypothetical protein